MSHPTTPQATALSHITWHTHEDEQAVSSLRWHSENHSPAPKKVCLADDTWNADHAYKLICEGTGLLWQGDYHQAKQMLQALGRRVERKGKVRNPVAPSFPLTFHKHRQAQAQKASILGRILIPIHAGYHIPLRRAPDVALAMTQAFGENHPLAQENFAISLRELLGIIGAYEWRKNGVSIDILDCKVHPYYGVFSPVRGEYLDLMLKAALPNTKSAASANNLRAIDVGTGSGVLSIALAKRGIRHILATDISDTALACARDNLGRLNLLSQVSLQECDLIPNDAKADLIVCNPPWLPVKPNAKIEYALYDPEHSMLKQLLAKAPQHLNAGGELWIVMSDLAEHLGLRARGELETWFKEAGMKVKAQLTTAPRHKKANDQDDPLHAARSKEVTSLWILVVSGSAKS